MLLLIEKFRIPFMSLMIILGKLVIYLLRINLVYIITEAVK